MTILEESGDSLIEVLIAVAILGVGVTGLLGALGTSVSMSSLQQNRAVSEALVREYSEAVRASAYIDCVTGNPVTTYSSLQPTSSAATVSSATVEFWDGSAKAFVTSCPGSDVLQRVTVTVNPKDDRIAPLSVQFAKRKPDGG